LVILAALKDVLTIDQESIVKPYLRVEHSADNALIKLLTDAAIQKADEFLNREFPINSGELSNIKLGCLQAVAYWYENRGDTANLPPSAVDLLQQYRFEPGF
jgi:hypothetical protein